MNITGWIRKPTRGQSGAMLVAALMFCVVSYNLYYCCQIKQRELEERQRELVKLKSDISLAEYTNSQLKAQVEYLATDAGAEEVAREKLGLVKPGEVSFVVLGGDDLRKANLKPTVAVETSDPGLMMRFMHWFFLG
ncbi:septum formation initiator family protein [bacterium]|nr:septum formation initiator family protein [bacterium]